MTLQHHALQYHNCLKEELLRFLKQRDNLSGRNYKKTLKEHLVARLHKLDQNATFRLFDLPPELREICFENAVACARDFRRLLLVSKQVYSEVRILFYKHAIFNLSLVAGGHSKGNPVFGMCTRYWDCVNQYENLSRIRFADMFYAQHHGCRNIRHLSLKGGLMIDTIRFGAAQSRLMVGGSRVLFMTCVFYAFNESHTHLETLTYEVVGYRDPRAFTTEDLLLTFWPLKLLA